MTNPPIPPSTPIKRSRVRHMEDTRLLARLEWLHGNVRDHMDRSRHTWAMRVLEAAAIEDELFRRGVPFRQTTRRRK